MFIEAIKMVLKVFKNNKLRTFLTMIGVYVGVLSVIIIISLSDATKESVKSELESVDNSIITIGLRQYEGRRNNKCILTSSRK